MMTYAPTELSHQPLSGRPIAIAIAACGLLALLAIVAQQPLVALGILLLAPVTLVLLRWPEAPTPVVLFLLYSNAVVVAVRFHGVPSVAGMLAPVALFIPLGYYLFVCREKLIIPSALPLVVLFVVVQMIGAVNSKYPATAFAALKVSVLEGAAIYFVISNSVRSPAMLKRAVWALLLAGAFMGGLSLWQQLTRDFHSDFGGFAQAGGRGFGVESLRGEVRQPRLSGPIGEQNRYAQIMLMLLPVGLFRIWGEQAGGWRLLAVGATVLTAAGCALAFSRGAAVAFVLMLLLMAAMRYIKFRQLGLVAAGLALLLLAAPQYNKRLASIGSVVDLAAGQSAAQEPDGAIRGRATAMLAAARVFADHPILGVGPGMFNFYSKEYSKEGGLRALEGTREAHSLYLEIAAEHGTLGLICFLGFIFVKMRALARARRRCLYIRPDIANMATAFMLAIVAYLTTGLFLHFSYARYFWIVFALAASATYVAEQACLTHRMDEADDASVPQENEDREYVNVT